MERKTNQRKINFDEMKKEIQNQKKKKKKMREEERNKEMKSLSKNGMNFFKKVVRGYNRNKKIVISPLFFLLFLFRFVLFLFFFLEEYLPSERGAVRKGGRSQNPPFTHFLFCFFFFGGPCCCLLVLVLVFIVLVKKP